MNLSEKLSRAALVRAEANGQRVDGCIIGDEGVIDLRSHALDLSNHSASPSGQSLPEIGESPIDDLYASSAPSSSRWRRSRRA